jgi:hypothetical protein
MDVDFMIALEERVVEFNNKVDEQKVKFSLDKHDTEEEDDEEDDDDERVVFLDDSLPIQCEQLEQYESQLINDVCSFISILCNEQRDDVFVGAKLKRLFLVNNLVTVAIFGKCCCC